MSENRVHASCNKKIAKIVVPGQIMENFEYLKSLALVMEAVGN